jgi:tetratricopeptide (TPR) repeat protein
MSEYSFEKLPHTSGDGEIHVKCEASVDSVPNFILEEKTSTQRDLYNGRNEKNNPQLVISYDNIGSVMMAKGQYGDALAVYEKSLSICEASFGVNSPEVAHRYDLIGRAFQKLGNLDEALQSFERALKIREGCSDQEDIKNDANYNLSCDLQEPPSTYDKTLQSDIPYNRLAQDKEVQPNKNYVGHVQSIDVRFERGGGGNNHPGNQQYLDIVRTERPNYQSLTTTYSEKRNIAKSIIQRLNKCGALFLTRDYEDDQKRYYILADDIVLKKVMQALRESPKHTTKTVTYTISRSEFHTIENKESKKVDTCRKRAYLRGRLSRMHKPKKYVDQITEFDVLCERGGKGNNHPGNRQYLDIVSDIKSIYQSLPDTAKKSKYDISMSIVDKIIHRGGHFLELEKIPQVSKRYYILSRQDARLKVSQALRNK